MNHFLYYIPGIQAGAEAKGAIARLVGPAITGTDISCQNTGAGPSGAGPGVMVAAIPRRVANEMPLAPGEVSRRLKYCPDPARQVWFEAKGYWVGYDVDHRPRASDLARPSQVNGYTYECPDSGVWVVPLARWFEGGTEFDQRIVYRPEGGIEMKPLARYESLCTFAAQHFERLVAFSEEGSDVDIPLDQEYADIAVEALGVNYHVGASELSLLGTLTVASVGLICGYLCDFPGLLKNLADRREKKTAPDPQPSDTSSGAPEK